MFYLKCVNLKSELRAFCYNQFNFSGCITPFFLHIEMAAREVKLQL